MQIKALKLTDFKGVKSAEYSFSDITKVSGQNGSGKSTIADAWYWLWSDKNYELKSNPNIQPIGVEECLPRVEAVVDINGVEVTVAKQQKKSVSKPNDKGISKTTISNSYEINSVPKTERDFKTDLEDRGIDFDKFLALSHPEVFTGQKAADMRNILFEMASTKSDLDIANMLEDAKDVAQLLESYKFEEIDAMHKASKKKAEQQVKSIPDQIVGLEKAKVDTDVAELELEKNRILEEIAKKEELISNNQKATENIQKEMDRSLEIQFKINDIERNSNDDLMAERKELDAKLYVASQKFHSAELFHKQAEQDLKRLNEDIPYLEEKKVKLQNEWKEVKRSTFHEYEELPALDESTLTCPTCGQALPYEIKQQRISDFDIRKKEHKAKYDAEFADFESKKKALLESITVNGNNVVEEIKQAKARIEELTQKIEECKAKKIEANKEEKELQEKLAEIPDKADLSANQEYEALCLEFHKLNEAIKINESPMSYRSTLTSEIEVLRQDLSEVEKKLGEVSNNVRIDEQIAQMRDKQREYEQAKADSEKILYQLSLVSKKKNELLVEEINSNFGTVKWILFDFLKNGEYKEVCVPTVDGRRFGDSTNKGREIVAKLDICNSLQKFFKCQLPVFLDNAESINDFNIPNMDCQLILMEVTEDKDLKVEVA